MVGSGRHASARARCHVLSETLRPGEANGSVERPGMGAHPLVPPGMYAHHWWLSGVCSKVI